MSVIHRSSLANVLPLGATRSAWESIQSNSFEIISEQERVVDFRMEVNESNMGQLAVYLQQTLSPQAEVGITLSASRNNFVFTLCSN